jgi:putative transposase
MKFSYQYKLRPNPDQCQKLEDWLNKLRCLYNWFLADRIDGYHQTFCQGGYCDFRTKTIRYPLTCSLTKNTQLHNPWKNQIQTGLLRSVQPV